MIVRVLLDTCAVRKLLHGDATRLSVSLVQQHRDTCKVSIAAGAFAEVTEQLIKGRLPFDVWRSGAHDLDDILDPEWPIFPNGKELAYLSGTQTQHAFDLDEHKAHVKAIWRFVRHAESLKLLTQQRGEFRAPDGSLRNINLTETRLYEVMKVKRDFWISCVRKVQRFADAAGIKLDEAKMIEIMKNSIGSAPTEPRDLADKLDAPIRMVARLYAQSMARRTAYDPSTEKRSSDAFDLDLLFAIPLPAVIVTADERFLNRLRGTNAPHSKQVCFINEFNNCLECDTLSSLVSDFQTPEEQLKEWNQAAYDRWERRGRPTGDDWADWFASEPIA
jgi:hypothetical protein